jgi:hypothetical protein
MRHNRLDCHAVSGRQTGGTCATGARRGVRERAHGGGRNTAPAPLPLYGTSPASGGVMFFSQRDSVESNA